MARPMPVTPPVMMAVLPARRFVAGIFVVAVVVVFFSERGGREQRCWFDMENG